MSFIRKYKKDLIFAAVIILSGLILLAVILVTAGKGGTVVVTVSGSEVIRFPLDEDLTYLIEGKGGGTNLLIIEEGKAYLTEASCPDGLCVHMGKIHSAGQSIICLPNEVVVSVESNTYSDEDVDIIVH